MGFMDFLSSSKETDEEPKQELPEINDNYNTLAECITAMGIEWSIKYEGRSALSFATHASVKFPGAVSKAALDYCTFLTEFTGWRSVGGSDDYAEAIGKYEKPAEKLAENLRNLGEDKENAHLLGITIITKYVSGALAKYKEFWDDYKKEESKSKSPNQSILSAIGTILSAIDKMAKIIIEPWLTVDFLVEDKTFIKTLADFLRNNSFDISLSKTKDCKLYVPKSATVNTTIRAMGFMIDNNLFDSYNRLTAFAKEDPKCNKLTIPVAEAGDTRIQGKFAITKSSLFGKTVKVDLKCQDKKNQFLAKGKISFKEDIVPAEAKNLKFWTISQNKGKAKFVLNYKISKQDFDSKRQELSSIIDGIKAECDTIKKVSELAKESKSK